MGNIPACQSSFSSAGDWDYSAPQGASTSVLRVPFAKKNNRELTDAYDWYTMLAYDYERAVSEQVPITMKDQACWALLLQATDMILILDNDPPIRAPVSTTFVCLDR
ncbi:uncharacterized protein UV8b_03579 [Ustilaginoidea virens]|uniref:Uncharacterized protein n=1 Tax=Ustilaginoidea virens TaxID=1159556 RepID=A0A8E5MGA5_USTVR|nr:uncharacterized protein UV8b_03579 [Ustilaginoidea virens]QUC19338.1 hypothetical protein UV8b_03579 [Ustilaginoidea virens]